MVNGDLKGVQAHLTRRKLALSKDENGHGLLHKAVYHGHRDIVDWLVEKYPESMEVKDWVKALQKLSKLAFEKVFFKRMVEYRCIMPPPTQMP